MNTERTNKREKNEKKKHFRVREQSCRFFGCSTAYERRKKGRKKRITTALCATYRMFNVRKTNV